MEDINELIEITRNRIATVEPIFQKHVVRPDVTDQRLRL